MAYSIVAKMAIIIAKLKLETAIITGLQIIKMGLRKHL